MQDDQIMTDASKFTLNTITDRKLVWRTNFLNA